MADAVMEPIAGAETVPPPETPVSPAMSVAASVEPRWLQQVEAATGIPRTVLAEQSPGYPLGWNTLAAIGHIESNDGRLGGSGPSGKGYPSVPILGPALDGGAFAGIHDSDVGLRDGDTVWDHAVGPFQFIPRTWRNWGADGNGDGQSDPNRIADASVAAARYLCHAGDRSGVEEFSPITISTALWTMSRRSPAHSQLAPTETV